jgi:hypothetical protein
MKTLVFFTFFLCILSFSSFSQDSIVTRIVLVGDGGELKDGKQPVADAIKKLIPMDARTTVIYLGDNLYRNGLPDDEYTAYKTLKAVLDSQLSIADNTPARIYMIPGNHDWTNGRRDGYDAIVRQQRYVDGLNKPNVEFYPKDGCPGPVDISLGPNVTLVLFDSQWWLHPYDKPGIESDCDYKTTDEVLGQLDDIFSRNAKKLVILACHHPFKSNGMHGGYYTLKQHIFPFTDIRRWLYLPLPLIGSVYPIARGVFGTPQDLKHYNYVKMINDVQTVAKSYRNIIFAAGHEHNLQLIRDSSYNYIVSGAGSKTTRVSKSKKSLFAASTKGFAVLEVSKSNNVRLTFYTVTDSIRNAYTSVILNFSTIVDPHADSLNRIVENSAIIKYQDTITISASNKYITHSSFKKFFMGNNYRQEWVTPVNMNVFNLTKEKGGLKIKSFGGGKQTKSLTLLDTAKKEWILRTIDKDPSKALPQNFRGTLADDVVQDFISASHPYASMAIPGLSKPLGLTVPKPELFFVPDDRAFGSYKRIFANTICFLEEKEPTPHNEKVINTNQVFEKLMEENDHRVDQPAVLRARLLDILVADFDRHFGQWKWATGDTGMGKLYYPIPRDRDQAMFYSDGFLMKLLGMQFFPFLKGFRYDIPAVNWLGESAKDFDRVFLTDLDKKEWQESISEVQHNLNDSVISAALKKLPPEIYAINGPVLIKKLISRRALLEKAGMTYYKFISKKVNIVGSNQKEYFKLTGIPDGLNVKVYGRKENNDTSFLMYNRTFDQRVTKEIRLYGLNDDDLFDIDSTVSSRIRLRVIGGKGSDTFNIKGRVQNYLYDMSDSNNYIQHMNRSRKMFSKEPTVNYYSILGFKYDRSSFPGFIAAINNDDGLLLGAGLSKKIFGFRNEPFTSFQRLTALYAINRGGVQFRYSGEFNHLIRNLDLVVLSEVMTPGINNFFGLGNNTEVDPTKSIAYYRVRYSHLETQLLFQKRFFEKVKVMAGPVFYYYWNNVNNNAGKILGTPSLIGLDSANVYQTKTYLGGKLAIQINNLNNELFPTRGIKWNTEFSSMAGISKTSNNITKLSSDMAVYASLSDPARLIAVIQLGAGHIFGNNYEYFQAFTLGANNFLKGFRKNRFAGTSTFYSSLELRLKLTDIKSYVLPGSLGLIGFNELGRVWLKKEASSRWHYTYGGGIYYIPFNLAIVSATIGFSQEEQLFNFSIGTKLNISF